LIVTNKKKGGKKGKKKIGRGKGGKKKRGNPRNFCHIREREKTPL